MEISKADQLHQLKEEAEYSKKSIENLISNINSIELRVHKLERLSKKKQIGGKVKMSNIEDVDIDESGTFKYILIKLEDGRFIVRGYEWAEYHADIYDKVEVKLGKVKSTCVGGGRIQHYTNTSILVYGYSVGFGRADHSMTVKLLKEKYPDYQSIKFTNDGY